MAAPTTAWSGRQRRGRASLPSCRWQVAAARPRARMRVWSAPPARSSCSPTRASCSIGLRCDIWSVISPIPAIGCVSGEDYIEGSETEGLYGKLELLLRREEARLHSIAGASGCFYGQRRELCEPFRRRHGAGFPVCAQHRSSGQACSGRAAGSWLDDGHVQSARRVHSQGAHVPARHHRAVRQCGPVESVPASGVLSFILWSHKLMRWLAPLPMVGCLVAAYVLREQPLYLGLFVLQIVLYLAAVAGMLWPALGGAHDAGPTQRLLRARERGRAQGAGFVARRQPRRSVAADSAAEVA